MSSSPVRTSADRRRRPESAPAAPRSPSSSSCPPPARSAGRFSGLLTTEGAFGRFADRLLALELPDLPAERRIETVEFVCRRAQQVPTPLRVGVIGLAAATGAADRIAGPQRTVSFLRSTTMPFVTELARMVRSLGFAFVWETWPGTSPSGRPDE